MRAPIQDRIGQIIVDEADVLLVVDRGIYPSDPYVPAWTLLSLENGQQYIMSEDWVDMQSKLGTLVRS